MPPTRPQRKPAADQPQPTSLIVSRGDLEDQRWLDQAIEAIDSGIEAVLDIARNWTELRNLSRLHPGQSAQEYVLAHVQHPLGPGVVVPLLESSNWSQSQIAAIAGVSHQAVQQHATKLQVDRPAQTLGADGKLRPAQVVREVTAEVIEPDAARPLSPIEREQHDHEMSQHTRELRTRQLAREIRVMAQEVDRRFGRRAFFVNAHPQMAAAALLDAFVDAARELARPTREELERELGAAQRNLERTTARAKELNLGHVETVQMRYARGRVERAEERITQLLGAKVEGADR